MPKFSPEQIGNMKVWISADSLNLTSGASVSTWQDKSGNSLNFLQPTVSRQPIFVSNVLNGKPVVRFTASTTQTMTLAYTFSNPCTIFYVAKQNGVTNARLLAGLSNNWLLGFHSGGRQRAYYEGWTSVSTGNPLSTTIPYIYGCTIQGGAIASKSYENGTIFANSTAGVTAPNGFSLNGHLSSSEFSDGDIAELIVYNSVLSDVERQKVETYLAYKYNILVATYAYPNTIGDFTDVDIYPSKTWYQSTNDVNINAKFKHVLNKNVKYKVKVNTYESIYSDYVTAINTEYPFSVQIPNSSLNIGINTLTLYIKDTDEIEQGYDFNITKEDRDTLSFIRIGNYKSEWNSNNNLLKITSDGLRLVKDGVDIITTNDYSHINTLGKRQMNSITVDCTDDFVGSIDIINDSTKINSLSDGNIWQYRIDMSRFNKINGFIVQRKD